MSKDEISAAQQGNPENQRITKWLQSSSLPPRVPRGSPYLQTLWHQRSFLTRDGVLYRRWEDVAGKGAQPKLQLVVPPHLTPTLRLLNGLHNAGGHLGIRKTLEKVRSRFYWPGLKQDVEDWCNKCKQCSSRKSPAPKSLAPLQQQPVERPMERVAINILGPLPETVRGNKYILVIGDYCTKWKEAYPMRNIEATTVARIFVDEFVCRFGVPEKLHTDQGRNFESTLIKEICQLLKITKTRTTPYHPQSDGMIERFNRTILQMLSITASENVRDWDLSLPSLTFAYRTSCHETTRATPFSLVYGREATLPEDILLSLPSDDALPTQEYIRCGVEATPAGHLQTSWEACLSGKTKTESKLRQTCSPPSI